jgi:hypothetical protein
MSPSFTVSAVVTGGTATLNVSTTPHAVALNLLKSRISVSLLAATGRRHDRNRLAPQRLRDTSDVGPRASRTYSSFAGRASSPWWRE